MKTGLLTYMIMKKANTTVVKLNIHMNILMKTGLLTYMIMKKANTTGTNRRLR
jgi:hypothetical protein